MSFNLSCPESSTFSRIVCWIIYSSILTGKYSVALACTILPTLSPFTLGIRTSLVASLGELTENATSLDANLCSSITALIALARLGIFSRMPSS